MSKQEIVFQAYPLAQYIANESEIRAAVERVLRSGRYILGEEVLAFEREWAAYLGAAHAFGVASGTDALQIALRACEIGPGDEVITTTHTAVATVAAIELAGATPVLVDIEHGSWLMDVQQVERRITVRTKAIIAVHLYGQAVDLGILVDIARRHRLRLIEDCAQSHGAVYCGRRTGTWGDLGCFSFYPTKNLGAIGDGGAVVTDSQELANRVRWLREYGWRSRYVSDIPGLNSRLDEIQAAILRVKLGRLDDDNAKRVKIAMRYSEAFSNCVGVPVLKPERTSVFHLYVICPPAREPLKDFLERRGIGTAIHYPVPVHLQPAYIGRLGNPGDFPISEGASEHLLSLPLYPELTVAEVLQVIRAVHEYFEQRSQGVCGSYPHTVVPDVP